MRSFPDDKLPPAPITAESLSINIMCIFPSPFRTVELTHFTLTRVNVTRKVSYLLFSFLGVFPPPPTRLDGNFFETRLRQLGGSLTCYRSFFSIVTDTVVPREIDKRCLPRISQLQLSNSHRPSVHVHVPTVYKFSPVNSQFTFQLFLCLHVATRPKCSVLSSAVSKSSPLPFPRFYFAKYFESWGRFTEEKSTRCRVNVRSSQSRANSTARE